MCSDSRKVYTTLCRSFNTGKICLIMTTGAHPWKFKDIALALKMNIRRVPKLNRIVSRWGFFIGGKRGTIFKKIIFFSLSRAGHHFPCIFLMLSRMTPFASSYGHLLQVVKTGFMNKKAKITLNMCRESEEIYRCITLYGQWIAF